MKLVIYSDQGIPVLERYINDDLVYHSGRVYKGRKCYYKGVGVPYKGHYTKQLEPGYELIDNSSVFYLGSYVNKKVFQGKEGIFREKYQPFFPDHIGTCSTKEGLIVINSMLFEKSSVEVLDCIPIDPSYNQTYYELNYSCDRIGYLEKGSPKALHELLEYCIMNHWNFLWDKGSISDISYNGLVSDVADLFKSDNISHKLGTVYSVLYSLYSCDKTKYLEYVKKIGLDHTSLNSIIFNSIDILRNFGVDISELLVGNSKYEIYRKVVIDYLVTGKNCAYCACDMFAEYGEQVKNSYIERTKVQLGIVV